LGRFKAQHPRARRLPQRKCNARARSPSGCFCREFCTSCCFLSHLCFPWSSQVFEEPVPGGFLGEFQTGFRWENYVEVVSTYFSHIGRSFLYASLATLFALLLGYPIAYVIGVKLRPYPLAQALALVLLIAPFFISFLLRTLAWKQIFSDEGFVVATLKTLQLIPSDAYLTGTPFFRCPFRG